LIFGNNLSDSHHQALGHDVREEVTFVAAEPSLSFDGNEKIMEAIGPRLLPVRSTNVREATLRWFTLTPTNYEKLAHATPDQWPKPDGTRTLPLGPRDNKNQASGILIDDLIGKDKRGWVMVDLQAKELPREHEGTFVQVTDLGITAHLTDETALVLVTSLAT